MRKVAVTGGIAAGKSTACYLFEQLGASVVSADAIVHQLLIPSSPLGKKVIALLGDEIVIDKKLNRKGIAQKVFRSPPLLEKLENIIHPEVQKVIEARYAAACQSGGSLFVAEVPLLYEAELDSFYDQVIVVICDEEQCKKRYQADGEEFLRRTQRLFSIEEKRKRAQIIIENNGSLDQLRQTIQITYNALKETL